MQSSGERRNILKYMQFKSSTLCCSLFFQSTEQSVMAKVTVQSSSATRDLTLILLNKQQICGGGACLHCTMANIMTLVPTYNVYLNTQMASYQWLVCQGHVAIYISLMPVCYVCMWV